MQSESTPATPEAPQISTAGSGLLWLNIALTLLTLLLTFFQFGATTPEAKDKAPVHTVDFDAADIAAIAAAVNQQLSEARAAEEAQIAQDSAGTLRSLAELQNQATKISELNDPIKISQALREIEGWEFTTEDLPRVREITDGLLGVLRTSVTGRVSALQNAALEERLVVEGKRKLAEAATVLELYPESSTQSDQKLVENLGEKQGDIAARLDSIQRLAYNRWAVDNIVRGFQRIANNKSSNPLSKNEHLVKPLAIYLAKIDPIHLEPATNLLYVRLLTQAQEVLGENEYQQLTQALVSQGQTRESLSSF
jgi:hypothetical protein